jgi:hypothetical protein
VPAFQDNAQQEDRNRAFESSNAHDIDALTDCFPHDRLGIVQLLANYVRSLLSHTIGAMPTEIQPTYPMKAACDLLSFDHSEGFSNHDFQQYTMKVGLTRFTIIRTSSQPMSRTMKRLVYNRNAMRTVANDT